MKDPYKRLTRMDQMLSYWRTPGSLLLKAFNGMSLLHLVSHITFRVFLFLLSFRRFSGVDLYIRKVFATPFLDNFIIPTPRDAERWTCRLAYREMYCMLCTALSVQFLVYLLLNQFILHLCRNLALPVLRLF